MTNDFITAARTEAEKRFGFVADMTTFEDAAVWARAYLAAQEPTDAEAEAAACALAAESEDFEEWDSLSYRAQEEFLADARLALNAAREVRP